MTDIRLTYTSTTGCIASCRPGESEIQPGEEVVIPLKPKNPAWPEYVKATLSALATGSPSGRVYLLDFQWDTDAWGMAPESCDFGEPRCFSCCDSITERLNSLISALPVTENDDGTFTFTG